MLYELVYNSIAVPTKFGDADLECIVTGARKRNGELGITGVLLYHRGGFIQLVEGSKESVLHVYHDIICRDRRHRSMEVVLDQPVERRGFPGWSMGFPPILEPATPPASADPDAQPWVAPVSTGQKLMSAIYRQMRRAAT